MPKPEVGAVKRLPGLVQESNHVAWLAQRELYLLAQQGDPSGLADCVRRGAKPEWSSSEALREAARRGRVEAVEILLSFGPSPRDVSLAIGAAAREDSPQALDLLLPARDPSGDGQALIAAIQSKSEQCIAKIAAAMDERGIERADSERARSERAAVEPLLMCARRGWLPGLAALMGLKPSRSSRLDALRAAIKNRHLEAALLLSSSMGTEDLVAMRAYAKSCRESRVADGFEGMIQTRIDVAAIVSELGPPWAASAKRARI